MQSSLSKLNNNKLHNKKKQIVCASLINSTWLLLMDQFLNSFQQQTNTSPTTHMSSFVSPNHQSQSSLPLLIWPPINPTVSFWNTLFYFILFLQACIIAFHNASTRIYRLHLQQLLLCTNFIPILLMSELLNYNNLDDDCPCHLLLCTTTPPPKAFETQPSAFSKHVTAVIFQLIPSHCFSATCTSLEHLQNTSKRLQKIQKLRRLFTPVSWLQLTCYTKPTAFPPWIVFSTRYQWYRVSFPTR